MIFKGYILGVSAAIAGSIKEVVEKTAKTVAIRPTRYEVRNFINPSL